MSLSRDQLPWVDYEEDYSFLRADQGRYSPIYTFPREDIPFLQGLISTFYEGDVFSLRTVPRETVPVLKAQ